MTLKELLEGKTFPVKVRLYKWPKDRWLEIIAASRNNKNYPCFNQDGDSDIIYTCYEDVNWELYTEPKKKKKMYAWLFSPVEYNESYELNVHDVKYTSTDYAIGLNYSEYYQPKRVPNLDFEMEE